MGINRTHLYTNMQFRNDEHQLHLFLNTNHTKCTNIPYYQNILIRSIREIRVQTLKINQKFCVQSISCHKTAITTSQSDSSTHDSRFSPVISRHKPSLTADKPLPSSIRVGLVRQRPTFTPFPTPFQLPIRLELFADNVD